MATAFFYTGDIEEGVAAAHSFVTTELGLEVLANPNVMTLRHGLMSVDDARKLRALAELAPTSGDTKALVISASRLFHEAQNALLKLFEEPPAGTVLILIIPAEGMLLPTLRSRLIELPRGSESDAEPLIVQDFLDASRAEREKIITKLLDRTKSDKDEEKQAARLVAIQLVEGLVRIAHEKWEAEKHPPKKQALQDFMSDTSAFLPIFHERSGPLKLIFEHVLLTIPF